MWVVRILSGPQAGHIFPVREGKNVVGRSPQSQIKLVSKSVSKEHCQIELIGAKILLTDLGSRNGTFVNGVQKKMHKLAHGDRLKLHDIQLEVLHVDDKYAVYFQRGPSQQPHFQQHTHHQAPYYQGNTAYHQQQAHTYAAYPQPQASSNTQEPATKGLEGMLHLARNYVDDVVLPGIYKLPEWLEFNWVLALFMGAYILLVTSLSAIPLIQIYKSSIEMESRTKAQAIAVATAEMNRSPLQENLLSSLNTKYASDQPGVKRALIVAPDGTIMAPPSLTDRPIQIDYFHTAKSLSEPEPMQVDSSTIVSVVPIRFVNSATGDLQTVAFSVVEYDMNNLAVTNDRVLSLFIQVFAIAIVIGAVLFFFLFKLIEFPFAKLNQQMDRALREPGQDLNLAFMFPPLQKLISNVNSALSRIQHTGSDNVVSLMEHDRTQEMHNIVQLVGFAALTISAHDNTISAVNTAFEERTGLSAIMLLNKSLESINDQALRLSMQDLLARISLQPDQLTSNELEFAGINYEVAAQAVYGSKKVAYYLIALLPIDLQAAGGAE